MSPGVLGFMVFIGMLIFFVVPVATVMWRMQAKAEERARRRKGWAAGTAGAVGTGTYLAGGGGCGGGSDGGGSGDGGGGGGGGCGGGGCGGGGGG